MKKYLTTLFTISILTLYANEMASYFELLDTYPQTLGPIGDATRGEIEILRDPSSIQVAEQKTHRKAGIVAQDNYWLWINDPVRFPSGAVGIYGRFLWRKSLTGIPGVAVLPLLENGKIALIRNFRHATRSWEYELPRGGVSGSETPFEAGQRELFEETGLISGKVEILGELLPDTGFTNTRVPILLAKIQKVGNASPEESEAIASVDYFPLDELNEGIKRGYILRRGQKISLRDPFLTYALYQAILQGHLKLK